MKFYLRFVASSAAALAFGLFVAASPAAAECDPETALFEDEFDFMDVTWSEPAEKFYVEDGKLILKDYWGQVNLATQNEGGNFCVDMTIVDAADIERNAAGVVFWWKDWDNYYELLIWGNGWVQVDRLVDGSAEAIVGEETLALKKGIGETNHVELKLNPKDATIFINGTKWVRFKGRQPEGGSPVGLIGYGGEELPATYAFDNFVVNETGGSAE